MTQSATDKLIADSLWRDISEAPKNGKKFLCLWLTHDPRAKDGLTLSITRWIDDERGCGWIPDTSVNVLPRNQDAAKLFRPLPDDRLANALKVAVEALDYIQFGTCDCTAPMELCICAERKAEETLAKINRIAEGE